MAKKDALLTFSENQALTDTALATSAITLSTGYNTLSDLGGGKQIYLQITVDVAAANVTDITFTLESDDNLDFSSATTHYSSGAIVAANLTAGATAVLVALPIQKTYQKYLGVRYTFSDAGTATFTAILTDQPNVNTLYADNITIS